MHYHKLSALAATLGFLSGSVVAASPEAASPDLTDELWRGWKIGLRPRWDSQPKQQKVRRQNEQNLQFFAGSIAGAGAPPITQSDDAERPFSVDGDTFTDFQSAADRACDNQKNECADMANNGGSHEVGDCDQQNDECKSGIATAAQTSFDGAPGGDNGGGDDGNNDDNNNNDNNDGNNQDDNARNGGDQGNDQGNGQGENVDDIDNEGNNDDQGNGEGNQIDGDDNQNEDNINDNDDDNNNNNNNNNDDDSGGDIVDGGDNVDNGDDQNDVGGGDNTQPENALVSSDAQFDYFCDL